MLSTVVVCEGCSRGPQAPTNLDSIVTVVVEVPGREAKYFDTVVSYVDDAQAYLAIPIPSFGVHPLLDPKTMKSAKIHCSVYGKSPGDVPANLVSFTHSRITWAIISAPKDKLPVPLNHDDQPNIRVNNKVTVIGYAPGSQGSKTRGAATTSIGTVISVDQQDWSGRVKSFIVNPDSSFTSPTVLVLSESGTPLGIGEVAKHVSGYHVIPLRHFEWLCAPQVCSTYILSIAGTTEASVELGALIYDPLKRCKSLTANRVRVSPFENPPHINWSATMKQEGVILPETRDMTDWADRTHYSMWTGAFSARLSQPGLSPPSTSFVVNIEFEDEAGHRHHLNPDKITAGIEPGVSIFPHDATIAPLPTHKDGGWIVSDAHFRTNDSPGVPQPLPNGVTSPSLVTGMKPRLHEWDEHPVDTYAAAALGSDIRLEVNRYRVWQSAMTCSADGRFFFAVDQDHMLRKFDTATWTETAQMLLDRRQIEIPKTGYQDKPLTAEEAQRTAMIMASNSSQFECTQLEYAPNTLLAAMSKTNSVWALDASTLQKRYEITLPGVQSIGVGGASPIAFALTSTHLVSFEVASGVVRSRIPLTAVYRSFPRREGSSVGYSPRPQIVLTDNGKHLFMALSQMKIHRFRIEGDDLIYEQSTRHGGIEESRGLNVSRDGHWIDVGMPITMGPNGPVTNSVGPAIADGNDLSKAIWEIKGRVGSIARTIAFDTKNDRIYLGGTTDFEVFDREGKSISNPLRSPVELERILAIPPGDRAVLQGARGPLEIIDVDRARLNAVIKQHPK